MRTFIDESMTFAFDHSQTDFLLGQIMQALQVGPSKCAQSDVETAHSQLRRPRTQAIAMNEDRILFAKIETGENVHGLLRVLNAATGVRGEICERRSLGALRQAEKQLQSQFCEQ